MLYYVPDSRNYYEGFRDGKEVRQPKKKKWLEKFKRLYDQMIKKLERKKR